MAGLAIAHLLQEREVGEYHLQPLARALTIHERRGAQVLAYGEAAKTLPPILNQRHSAAGDHGGMCAFDAYIVEGNRALDDLPLFEGKHSGNGLHQGGLSGAIGPQQCHHPALLHEEIDILQGGNRLVVADRNIVDVKHCSPLSRRISGLRSNR